VHAAAVVAAAATGACEWGEVRSRLVTPSDIDTNALSTNGSVILELRCDRHRHR